MPKLHREALVPYTDQQMYHLVNNIQDYHLFLPWCKSSRVLSQNTNEIVATLVLAKGGVHKAFTTKNTLIPFNRIEMNLVDGPFKFLKGEWGFTPKAEGQCLVTLDLEFEFSSKILAVLIGPVFNDATQQMVSAFTEEAKRRYGA